MTEQIRRIVPNISTERMDESVKFYTEFVGLNVVMDMGWIVTLASPNNPTAQLSLIKADSPGNNQSFSITIEVADVVASHAKAVSLGLCINYPLTDEPWGVRRFGVTDPNGLSINIMSHIK